MEALAVGDLHTTDASGIGGLSKYVQDSDKMVFREFDRVLEYGRNKGVHTVIQLGDVCENPRMSYSAQLALVDFLDRNSDFEFHFILGNHDMFGEVPDLGHSLELLQRMYKSSHVKFYTKPTNKLIQGARVRFLPYPHESFKKDALNVFHKEVAGAKNDAGRTFDGEDFSRSKAVAIAGHLHTAHRIRNTFYGGTLFQTNFGESLPKYFQHVEFNSVDDYEIRQVKHEPEYKLYNVVLQSRSDLQDIPEGEKNLVKLIIQDGAEVSAGDYAQFTNIVEVKNFKTKEDLAVVLTEDLSEGQEVVFKVSEFFQVWIDSYDVPEEMRGRIRKTRRRVLDSVRGK